MPRTKRQKRLLINNQTSKRIHIYYQGVPGYKLRVIVLLFPEEDQKLASSHHEAVIEPKHFLSIPLGKDWKTFDGFVYDSSRVKHICFKIEQIACPENNEYILKIKELTN